MTETSQMTSTSQAGPAGTSPPQPSGGGPGTGGQGTGRVSPFGAQGWLFARDPDTGADVWPAVPVDYAETNLAIASGMRNSTTVRLRS